MNSQQVSDAISYVQPKIPSESVKIIVDSTWTCARRELRGEIIAAIQDLAAKCSPTGYGKAQATFARRITEEIRKMK